MKKVYCKGILPIGNVELNCYVLDDKENTRVISATSIFTAFERQRRGSRERDGFIEWNGRRIQIPPFMVSNKFESLMTKEIIDRIQPIEFLDGNSKKNGYDANLLPDICNLYLTARRNGLLTEQQLPTADRAEILLTSFAKVGIIALVDEATGFQTDRKHDALRIILEKYINEAMQKWIKMFPDEFFSNLDRLYKNDKTISQKRPQYYGKFINTYIYEPLEKGYIKQKLNELNIDDTGKRKARFHQWLTDFGKNKLTSQIWKTIGVMETSTNIRQFKERQVRLEQPNLFDELEEKL